LGVNVLGSTINDAFAKWCARTKTNNMGAKQFKAAMKIAGIEHSTRGGALTWKNIRLKDDAC
jgi:hypothetical protein